MRARRFIASLIVTGCGGAALLTAAPDSLWARWRFSAPITTAVAPVPGLVAVTLTADVTSRAAAGWPDVRVVDDTDHEVPYVLRVHSGSTELEWRPARLLDPSVTAERFSQITVDSGPAAQVHNAIRLGVQTDRDFLSWAEIAVSDDARSWRVLRERAPIYSLTADGLDRRTQVGIPDSAARYFRVRILDAAQKYTIVSADTALETSVPAETVASPAVFREETLKDRRSRFVVGPDDSIGPVAEVWFNANQTAFDRSVAVETSDDGARWRQIASGEIFRMTEHGVERVGLKIGLPDVSSRYWRVTVFNRDDAPLTDGTVTLAIRPRRVIFEQAPGRRYRLLVGNSKVAAPAYEMSRLTDTAALDAAAPAPVGPIVEQALFVEPEPWTERHPAVLWTGLVLVVFVIGLLAVKALKA